MTSSCFKRCDLDNTMELKPCVNRSRDSRLISISSITQQNDQTEINIDGNANQELLRKNRGNRGSTNQSTWPKLSNIFFCLSVAFNVIFVVMAITSHANILFGNQTNVTNSNAQELYQGKFDPMIIAEEASTTVFYPASTTEVTNFTDQDDKAVECLNREKIRNIIQSIENELETNVSRNHKFVNMICDLPFNIIQENVENFNLYSLYNATIKQNFENLPGPRAENARLIHQGFALKFLLQNSNLKISDAWKDAITVLEKIDEMLYPKVISDFKMITVESWDEFNFTHNSLASYNAAQYLIDKLDHLNQSSHQSPETNFVMQFFNDVICTKNLEGVKKFLLSYSSLREENDAILKILYEANEKNLKNKECERFVKEELCSYFEKYFKDMSYTFCGEDKR